MKIFNCTKRTALRNVLVHISQYSLYCIGRKIGKGTQNDYTLHPLQEGISLAHNRNSGETFISFSPAKKNLQLVFSSSVASSKVLL